MSNITVTVLTSILIIIIGMYFLSAPLVGTFHIVLGVTIIIGAIGLFFIVFRK